MAYVQNILNGYGLSSYEDVGELATHTLTDRITYNNRPSEVSTIFKGKNDTQIYVNHVGEFLQKISSNS